MNLQYFFGTIIRTEISSRTFSRVGRLLLDCNCINGHKMKKYKCNFISFSSEKMLPARHALRQMKGACKLVQRSRNSILERGKCLSVLHESAFRINSIHTSGNVRVTKKEPINSKY